MAFALTVGGVDLCDYALADINVTIGRETVFEQPLAGTLVCALVSDRASGPATPIEIAQPLVLAASEVAVPNAAMMAGMGRAAGGWQLFQGWVTDVEAWLDDDGQWITRVTAAGPLGPLARTPLADSFAKQTDSERIAAILTAALWDATAVPVGVDGPILEPQSGGEDTVCSDLLREAAESGGGLLYEDHQTGNIGYQPRAWRTVAAVAAIWDNQRVSWDEAGAYSWDDIEPDVLPAFDVPCHAVYRDSVRWTARAADVATYVEVEYGQENNRAFVTSGDLAPPVYGERVSSIISNKSDAQILADRLYAVRKPGRWTVSAMNLDVAELTGSEVAGLGFWLRPGRRLRSVLPAGSPSRSIEGFLEGWRHAIRAEADGGVSWLIDLSISEWTLTAPATSWDEGGGAWDDYADIPWNTPILEGM